MAGGRPSKYNQTIAKQICIQLQKGESLRKICSDPSMPTRETVMNWTLDNLEFLSQYTQSREIQMECYLDEILEWCDKAIDQPAKAQAYKIKIDALKWYASKVKPKIYGEKQELKHSGYIDRTPIDYSNLTDVEIEELRKLADKARDKAD